MDGIPIICVSAMPIEHIDYRGKSVSASTFFSATRPSQICPEENPELDKIHWEKVVSELGKRVDCWHHQLS